jgi:hypothetical protein
VERKSIRRKWNRKRLESSRSGTDASTENKNNLQIDAKIETDEKRPAAEESCTVTETEPVKTSGPLRQLQLMASDLSRNNSAEEPTLRHRAAHNDAKKNDRAADPDQELEYERKKKKVSDEVPTQNKMQIRIFH